ncbi:MAG: error-prone DNA polymerase [Azospirillaceae bacterium]
MTGYVELQVATNFSFLEGGSHAEELAVTAAALGHRAIAVTDRNSLAGAVRMHLACRDAGIRAVIGARLDLADGSPSLLAFPRDRAAYGRLSRLITLGRRRAPKGECHLTRDDVVDHAEDWILIALPPGTEPDPGMAGSARQSLSHGEREGPVAGGHGRVRGDRRQNDAPKSVTPHPDPLPQGEGTREADSARQSLSHGEREGPVAEGHGRVRGDRRQNDAPKSVTPHPDPLPEGEGTRMAGSAPSRAPHDPDPWAGFEAALAELCDRLAERAGVALYLAAAHGYRGDDARRIALLADMARRLGTPMVATNAVRQHAPDRRPLADVLTCIARHTTIDAAGWALEANAERHLKAPAEMARLFRDHPEALARTVAIAEACSFSLDELVYEYPDELREGHDDPQAALVALTREGMARRYPEGVPDRVVRQIDHELALIGQLGYAPYFLTVHDIVRFARSRGILCQGRGSAANSAVCYVLGITAVDPARADLLFERFVSAERGEPPDIDVDFEHERREEVIQYIYERYGRDRAGMTATVICYRARGAIREVGKAMGLSEDTVDRLARTLWGWSRDAIDDAHIREAGLDPTDRRLRQAMILARRLIGFPRHLSQHVGGFVISRGPLSELVPIENAAMADRTVIEWDKDDLDALGILKIDVLALGMLSCVRRGFDLLDRHYDRPMSLAGVPAEDPAVYDMLCKADSLGVFQVESRAQMTMLPRLKPRAFYDLVIEVAIVRPGPIQGDMVHPYLRRRNGEEEVEYPSGDLRPVLEKTLGVPLFQEQAMKIAIVGAGFSPSEADRLRRAMATFKKLGDIHKFRDKMVGGMIANGYNPDFAERCFKQIEGFGTYGFPESHAASFALLVYVSAWLKCHYPDVFACALINSQPMGFYAPAQIVRDAREHGVEVRAPDVNHSDHDCTLEPLDPGPDGRPSHALRLGLRLVKGLREDDARCLVAERAAGGAYADPRAIWRRAGLAPAALEALARADAFRSTGLDRREAGWAVKALGPSPLPLFAGLDREAEEPAARLPAMPPGEHVVQDYGALSLTLKSHPMALLRDRIAECGYAPAARLAALAHGRKVAVAGLVLVRQRPGSAKGVIFVTLEDETGVANLVVLPPIFEAFRKQVLGARLLGAAGRVEKQGTVIHLKVDRLYDLSDKLALLTERVSAAPAGFPGDWTFGDTLARADEVRHPNPDPRDKPDRLELQKARSFR